MIAVRLHAADVEQAKPATITARHVVAATIGNALEYYDFLIYSLFALQIGATLYPTTSRYASLMLSLAIFGVGFLTRPVGALVVGRYADRAGRRPAMIMCFTLSGLSTLAMALVPTYAATGVIAPLLALLARLVQGFAVGGETGSNTAFLLEAAPSDRRGLFVSFGAASQLFALLVGGVVGATLTELLPAAALASYGWRIAFLLGAAILPVGLWLRRSLPETLHLVEERSSEPQMPEAATWSAHRRLVLLGLVILSCGTVQGYVLTYIVTYAQSALGMTARSGFLAQIAAAGMAIIAVIGGGWLSDRIGRRPVNIAGQALFLLTIYPSFAWAARTRSELVLVIVVAAMKFTGSLRQGSFYTAFSESFVKSVRGTGFGTVYALSIAVFGGTTQLVVTWLLHVTDDPLSPAYFLMAATALGLFALFWLPESAPTRVGRLADQVGDSL